VTSRPKRGLRKPAAFTARAVAFQQFRAASTRYNRIHLQARIRNLDFMAMMRMDRRSKGQLGYFMGCARVSKNAKARSSCSAFGYSWPKCGKSISSACSTPAFMYFL
jgi:hypothetical protein